MNLFSDPVFIRYCTYVQGANNLSLTARRYVLVSVTRGHHRVESWYFSHKTVTVQGGFGAVFGIQVQIFVRTTRVAVLV
jgi:hypothetical protein